MTTRPSGDQPAPPPPVTEPSGQVMPSDVQARRLLATLLERAGAAPDRRTDPYWYRLGYLDLTDRYHRTLLAGGTPRDEVRASARALATDLEQTLVEGTTRRRFGLRQDRRAVAIAPFLAGIESTVLVFLADAMTVGTVWPGDVVPGRPGGPAGKDRATEVRREVLAALGSPDGPDAVTLLRAALEIALWPPRALYNLACYWSTGAGAATDRLRDECLDTALENLALAVAGDPTLGQRARTDPTLATARTDGRTAAGFATLVGQSP